ncbi:MAG: 1-(5-phosphoribosyl)-5-[(5-phosphoribosylamino)methylideneamino]imidazole-4-carboxamide isomerase [Nitrospinota bacterium]|nr:MAG: 1-(5-phosphoribosyl)-5-[(5-phosphoribosylamino)methylideneamino]imidazole-4-carboxamide isomerase [Nitrospinota bacterium]
MLLIPAIDLKGGKCVRLRQGDLSQETVYSDDPVAMARHWEEQGATWLHLVDLEGAVSGSAQNREAITRIVEATRLQVQLGGGIRDLETIRHWLELGVERVVLGTVAVQNPSLVAEACQHFPGRIAVALDIFQGRVAIKGWREVSEIDALALAHFCAECGVTALIITDIQRDGMLQGPNLQMTEAFASQLEVPVILSGGISTLEDLQRVKALHTCGVVGVIVGRALYAGTIDFRQGKRILEEG